MIKIKYILVFIFYCTLYSCNEDERTKELDNSLATLLSVHPFEIDNVIACASSAKGDENTSIVYLYPRPGATDIQYYETSDVEVAKNEYRNYQRVYIETSDLFNGYLRKFTRSTPIEKWVIITFFEDGKLHLSNPIRLKHRTKPTAFTDQVTITNTTENMPLFTWTDGVFDDTVIYFQVISDMNTELLSGTYTVEKQFQYYTLDNVVLNITAEVPPPLNSFDPYYFTLMGVSEDNWVNLFIDKQFFLRP